MPYINSTEFGSITIDGKKYDQVLIIDGKVSEREYSKLKDIHKTSHQVGEWELKQLLEGKPEAIVIGTGQDGVLKVDENTKRVIKENNIEIFIEKTPDAIITYNTLIKDGGKVNALIHTTC